MKVLKIILAVFLGQYLFPQLAAPVQVYIDDYGAPHIYANDEALITGSEYQHLTMRS
jgi:acyl-homoserine lactone acylase PvdQ